jgi:4-hydroxy-tetrahydrodipicolinate synthase
MANITGTGVALITPFSKDGEVDYKSLGNLVEYCIAGKVDNLLALGTTAETATLTSSEKNKVVNYILDVVNGRLPVILGIGSNNTKDVVDKIKAYEGFNNIEALLSVTPYYNKPSQEGLYLHYKAVAEASPVPVIMYNVPGRTGVNINADTAVKIASEIDNIAAIKEASGNVEQISQILKNKPEGFHVLSGDDGITLPLLSLGVSGVISVVANAFPEDFSKMVNLCRQDKFKEALPYHFRLVDIISALFEEGNPAGVKAVLTMKGIIQNYLRLPLIPASKKLYDRLERMVNTY